jgi:hypothetical protein
LAAALVICACSAGGARIVSNQAPALSMSGAEQVMVRADDVRRSALEDPRTARLPDAFRGRALQMLEAQSKGMDQRGLRMEERSYVPTLVFWDPRAGEAVLQVTSERRLVTSDEPNPGWAAAARQWWGRLQYADAGWWVIDQEDLTPDRWRPVAPAG